MSRGKCSEFKQLWLEGKTFKYIAAFFIAAESKETINPLHVRCEKKKSVEFLFVTENSAQKFAINYGLSYTH